MQVHSAGPAAEGGQKKKKRSSEQRQPRHSATKRCQDWETHDQIADQSFRSALSLAGLVPDSRLWVPIIRSEAMMVLEAVLALETGRTKLGQQLDGLLDAVSGPCRRYERGDDAVRIAMKARENNGMGTVKIANHPTVLSNKRQPSAPRQRTAGRQRASTPFPHQRHAQCAKLIGAVGPGMQTSAS